LNRTIATDAACADRLDRGSQETLRWREQDRRWPTTPQRTTQVYDRRRDELSLDEVERIVI
jgi:hypothetical protein